jgi:hypothetical protein
MEPDDVKTFMQKHSPMLEPRDYQFRIISKGFNAITKDKHKSVLIESPTGSGKSAMGLYILKLIEEYDPTITFGWVAMRRKLLDQAVKENNRIGVKNIDFISMFDKNPPKRDLMVTDECVPGDTKLICLVNGKPSLTTMDQVMSGIGTHILSADEIGFIFQPILNRTDMGEKDVFTIETNHGILYITENGKVWNGVDYKYVSELSVSEMITSCCQPYSDERRTTDEQVSDTSVSQKRASTTLCVRVWPEGSVELTQTLLQKVSVQSSPNSTESILQIQTLPSIPTNGKILSIRKDRKTKTYDIGVMNTNCFFANGILIHNCQHDAADTCAAMHETMNAKWSIGLTATPFRTDRIKLAYEKIINDCGVRFLIEQGHLSNFDQYVLPEWTPQVVVDRFMERPGHWGKSVIYFKNKDLCFETEKMLKDQGISAAVMLGNYSPSKREELFGAFEDGSIQVLINVYLLTEGFDAPDLMSVWVRDSGKLCTMQMAGRGLRKDPSNPNKVARVIQSENTGYPYARTAKPYMQYVYVDNTWRSIEPGPQVENTSEKIRKELYVRPVQLPRFLENGGGIAGLNKHGSMVIKKRGTKHNNSLFMFGLDE